MTEITANPAPPIDDPSRLDAPQDSEIGTPAPAVAALTPKSMGDYDDNDFDPDKARYKVYAARKTGFAAMDTRQPFYPGLYGLGGASSSGKTTLALQLADNMAAAGEHVIYFSLEQSQFELYSKCLSREFFLANRRDTLQNNRPSPIPMYTSTRLRCGDADGTPELAAQRQAYKARTGGRLSIVEGKFAVTVETILATVSKYIADNGVKPVVVVDYLQIVAASYINGRFLEGRASIDHIVHQLKVFQTEHDLTVIVLSSLNRQSYTVPVDYESFKESGGIEYTADVLWGLQLSCMSNPLFAKDKGVKDKHDMINAERAKTPRDVQLVYLKNRYGSVGPGCTADFKYYPFADTLLSEIKGQTGPSPDL